MEKMSSSNYETPSSPSSELTRMMDETAASCLMLLSKVGEWSSTFDCKTCGKVFSTFQALGGHRASHKKQKLDQADQSSPIPARPRSHKCSICGAEFALGQALGGHMRRHRGSAAVSNKRVVCLDLSLNLTPPGENDDLKLQLGKRDFEMKKSTDLERLQEYDLRTQMGKRRRYGDVFLGLVA